jgi:hypothetical protein
LLLLLALAGCNDDASYLAVVDFEGLHVRLIGPPTVHVGQDFTVSVLTPGGGCIEADHADVVTEGPDTVILPYDVYVDPGRNGACIRILEYVTHVVSLRFDSAGTKTIRVRAQRSMSLPPREPGEVIDTVFTIESQ